MTPSFLELVIAAKNFWLKKIFWVNKNFQVEKIQGWCAILQSGKYTHFDPSPYFSFWSMPRYTSVLLLKIWPQYFWQNLAFFEKYSLKMQFTLIIRGSGQISQFFLPGEKNGVIWEIYIPCQKVTVTLYSSIYSSNHPVFLPR